MRPHADIVGVNSGGGLSRSRRRLNNKRRVEEKKIKKIEKSEKK